MTSHRKKVYGHQNANVNKKYISQKLIVTCKYPGTRGWLDDQIHNEVAGTLQPVVDSTFNILLTDVDFCLLFPKKASKKKQTHPFQYRQKTVYRIWQKNRKFLALRFSGPVRK